MESKISDKYIAGFLDSDGCVSIHWKAGKYKPLLILSWSQKTSQDKVLYMIQGSLGGVIREDKINEELYSKLVVSGSAASMALNRIKKHLVLKRHYANVCLDLVEKGKPDDVKVARLYMKEQRKVRSLPLPNFPSRKWLAGYFDGDGCLYARMYKTGVTMPHFSIAASWFDTEGLEIIQKNFGGQINKMSQGNNVQSLVAALPPSRAKKFLGYFAKHLITKKEQAYFILGCAEMGHYRDGKNIWTALKQLKAQPHRLSEPEVDVKPFLDSVSGKKWGRHGHGAEFCKGCGRNDVDYYAKDYCRNCYNNTRYQPKRQSAIAA